jgi:eukaryotic-like serine/threonine-protein kinase
MKFTPPLAPSEVEAVLPHLMPVTAIQNGIGGQGVVFRGRLGSADIAVKIYYPGATTERTDREFQFLQRSRCPNLASIHSCGVVRIRASDCIFSVTPFIDGDLLSQLIKSGPRDVKSSAALGADIARAIETMWAERVVHRDIKPPNIIIGTNGAAVLFDLGVARHLTLDSLTSVGNTWGTMGYMAPEQARAMRMLSCKADVFALGIVLQECLLGRHPVNHNQRLLLAGGPPTAPILPSISPAFCGIIDAMVAKETHRRLTPSQVIERLNPWR